MRHEPITAAEYRAFQQAYDFFNAELFGGALPHVLVTLQRHAKMLGYFSPERFSGRIQAETTAHELAMNRTPSRGVRTRTSFRRSFMKWPWLQAQYGLTEAEIQEHVDLLQRVSTIVEPVVSEAVIRNDPKDDPVLYTAVEGRADVW